MITPNRQGGSHRRDTYEQTRLEDMLAVAGNYSAVFSNNYYENGDGKTITPPHHVASLTSTGLMTVDEHLKQFYISGNSLHPCSMLIRSNDYRDLGGFPAYLHRLGDMVFFTKLLSTRAVHIMERRLQTITAWEDLRNESAGNVKNIIPTIAEVSNFYELFALDPILSRVEKIFASHMDSVQLDGEAERLWYLGNVSIGYGDLWKMQFSFRCLYRAIEMDEPRISNNTFKASGMGASEYVAHLASTNYLHHFGLSLHPKQAAQQESMALTVQSPSRVSLRQYVRQFTVLHPAYRILKLIVKGSGSLNPDRTR
ncbi:MAG: hypothetical protein POH28_10785 [Acidocella sp.]|nr:hypothetical protein [Acidocella sp.]